MSTTCMSSSEVYVLIPLLNVTDTHYGNSSKRTVTIITSADDITGGTHDRYGISALLSPGAPARNNFISKDSRKRVLTSKVLRTLRTPSCQETPTVFPHIQKEESREKTADVLLHHHLECAGMLYHCLGCCLHSS